MIPVWIFILLLAPFRTFADERARPTGPKDYPGAAAEEFVDVPGSEVAWADYEALRRDFPQLRHLDNASINVWILQNYARISRGQAELAGLRNTVIPSSSQPAREGLRPQDYHRASVIDGVDLKGTGLDDAHVVQQRTEAFERLLSYADPAAVLEALRVKDHSDGLMSLGEAVAEVTRQRAAQKLFDLHNATSSEKALQSVESYFVIALPFDIHKKNGQSLPAAIYGRQTHIGRGRVLVPPEVYRDDFGHFQASSRTTAVDFGGVTIEDSRLKAHYDVVEGRNASNPQNYKPWVWGHETADAFRRGDKQAVFRHVDEMTSPIDAEWSRLQAARRRHVYARSSASPSRQGPAQVIAIQNRRNASQLAKWIASDNPEEATLAADLLKNYEGPDAERLIRLALAQDNVDLRQGAAVALRKYQGPRYGELLQLALRDQDRRVLDIATKTLESYRGPDAQKLFELALDHPSESVRRSVCQVLQKRPDILNAEMITKALRDSDYPVQLAAEELRTILQGGPSGEAIKKMLASGTYMKVSAGIKALETYGGADAYDLLKLALEVGDDELRARAVALIPHYRGPEGGLLLKKALQDPVKSVNKAAATALRDYSGPDKTELIKKALANPSEFVPGESLRALKGFTPDEDLWLLALQNGHSSVIDETLLQLADRARDNPDTYLRYLNAPLPAELLKKIEARILATGDVSVIHRAESIVRSSPRFSETMRSNFFKISQILTEDRSCVNLYQKLRGA